VIEVGHTLGSYEILSRLGSGGMATLFLARRRGVAGFSRLVAIKVLHPHLAVDPDLVKMFIQEAKLCSRIVHPAVVHVEELGEADGRYYLAMEYVHGCALSALLQRLGTLNGRLTPEVATWIAVRVAEGLHEAHELTDSSGKSLSLVHRDVSPQNILISRSGHVKIIDFGIAKIAGRVVMTQPGLLKGKLSYMSPEQARGESLDRRSDVYALGVVVWEMLTTRRLFVSSGQTPLLDLVRDPDVEPPSAWVPDIPEALDVAVMDALSADRESRLPTARAFRNRLVQAVPDSVTLEAARLAAVVRAALGEELDAADALLPPDIAEGKRLRDPLGLADELKTTVPVLVNLSVLPAPNASFNDPWDSASTHKEPVTPEIYESVDSLIGDVEPPGGQRDLKPPPVVSLDTRDSTPLRPVPDPPRPAPAPAPGDDERPSFRNLPAQPPVGFRLTNRRRWLGAMGLAGIGAIVGARYGIPWWLRPGPVRPVTNALVERAFAGIDRSRVVDAHVHIVGLGSGGTGCWVNPEMSTILSPIRQLKFDIYKAAAGIRDDARADAQYVERLVELHRHANPDGKLLAMAFDYYVDGYGNEVPERSEFFTPNEYVLRLAAEYPELLPCASIHPYRRDAVERLDRVAAAGARAIKWLPNAMGMDPGSSRCDAFYRRLAELGLPLITHTGEEQAVESEEAQELGNPLRLRRPLDAGVRVVAAHCGSLGVNEDIDMSALETRSRSSFELFVRLFTESQYERTLFADVSALTQVNRCGQPLREMLLASHLHARLVNGSDYPLPAIDPLVSTYVLEDHGYLDSDERSACNEVFDANPLLFDFVVKRSLRVRQDDADHGFAPSVFESAWLFEGGQPPA